MVNSSIIIVGYLYTILVYLCKLGICLFQYEDIMIFFGEIFNSNQSLYVNNL